MSPNVSKTFCVVIHSLGFRKFLKFTNSDAMSSLCTVDQELIKILQDRFAKLLNLNSSRLFSDFYR